jgi:3-oxoacyl-(acyl-carrier-protein) synthase
VPVEGPRSHPLLDVSRRRQEMAKDMAEVSAWAERFRGAGAGVSRDVAARMEHKRRAAVWETWGQGFYRGLPDISPLTGALAVWGLSIDDVGVVSCHGTSTTLNDKNESGVCQLQFEKLGRTPGNLVLVVAQKWLTAHPKGAAAAWMLNGVLQILQTGCAPLATNSPPRR